MTDSEHSGADRAVQNADRELTQDLHARTDIEGLLARVKRRAGTQTEGQDELRAPARQRGALKQAHGGEAASIALATIESPTHGLDTRASVSRATNRRREVSHASARSLLMTVLGEYVLPRSQPVWTSTLIEALHLLDIEEKSARQALARSSAEGWVVLERVGRRVRWSLTPPGRRLLTEGAERIYAFGNDERPWDGHWLMLIVSVPEAKRDLRHRLRTRLTWAGFGSPATGVWVSPDPSSQRDAQQIMQELGLDAQAMSFTSMYGDIGDQQSMVAKSWDLTELNDRYEDFIDRFTGLRPSGERAVLRAQTELVHEWRSFPFLDPRLPLEFLPDDWSGVRAAELFRRKHVEWRPEAQTQWDELVQAFG